MIVFAIKNWGKQKVLDRSVENWDFAGRRLCREAAGICQWAAMWTSQSQESWFVGQNEEEKHSDGCNH